jgi:predicted 2-oxoglutarate/Fe(II)-dependent dioxygenase YbiX
LDPNLRVLAVHKVDDPQGHPAVLAEFLLGLPTLGPPRAAMVQAPVLLVPMVFEVEFCRRLVQEFDQKGGRKSGILEDFGGKTFLTFDETRKRRQDMILSDSALQQAAHARIARRLAPEVRKAFQLPVTRLERSVVARYGVGDFMAPHRDNAARGTAHRQFAVTINLNADDYSGGHMRFPEFGPQIYQIPTGCAMVHSCGLLHEVMPVREGARYAFIPVVYGEGAAQLRDKNKEFLGEGVTGDRREIEPEATT